MLLPTVLVSAARFGAGLSDDLRRVPVPAIVEQTDGSADALPLIFEDDVPLPRPRVEVVMPDVPIAEVCDRLASAAEAHRLPLPFFIRLIWQESRFDPAAISPVGAQGVAQFMPATAAAMGLKNPFDPLEALSHSARLLRELMAQFGNLGLAAAAYNAGPKRILDWLAKRGTLPEETRNYVMSITGHAAERWRFTKPGQLALDVPKRAPCRDGASVAYMVEVPAPPPPPVKKKPARARLLAKGKDKGQDKEAKGNRIERKSVTAARKKPGEVSAARKGSKTKPKTAPKTKTKTKTKSKTKTPARQSKPLSLVAKSSAAKPRKRAATKH